MEESFVDLDKLNKIRESTDELVDLYQIQSTNDSGFAIIKFIGQSNIKEILIHEFKFKNYDCIILSHLLDTNDLKNKLKILSLNLYKSNKLIATIVLLFNSDHFIETNKIIKGNYCYELITVIETKQIGSSFDELSKATVLYNLIALLSDDELSFLFD